MAREWCPNGNPWTPEQDAYLCEHWGDQTDKEMAAVVGHPVSSTRARRLKLGLRTRKSSKGPDWTEEEVELMEDLWGNLYDSSDCQETESICSGSQSKICQAGSRSVRQQQSVSHSQPSRKSDARRYSCSYRCVDPGRAPLQMEGPVGRPKVSSHQAQRFADLAEG